MAVPAGPKLQVAELVMIAQQRGCQLKRSSLRLVTPTGFLQIKYLFNPANKGRFDLTDYEAEEYLVWDEIKNAARRLGIFII